jgi:hypothetical protein
MNALTDFEKDLGAELSKDFPDAKLKHEPMPLKTTAPAKLDNDAERYLAHLDTLIHGLRRRMMDAETEHLRERSAVMQATVDKVKAMDREHNERLGRLRGMLAKLEAAKDA